MTSKAAVALAAFFVFYPEWTPTLVEKLRLLFFDVQLLYYYYTTTTT